MVQVPLKSEDDIIGILAMTSGPGNSRIFNEADFEPVLSWLFFCRDFQCRDFPFGLWPVIPTLNIPAPLALLGPINEWPSRSMVHSMPLDNNQNAYYSWLSPGNLCLP